MVPHPMNTHTGLHCLSGNAHLDLEHRKTQMMTCLQQQGTRAFFFSHAITDEVSPVQNMTMCR